MTFNEYVEDKVHLMKSLGALLNLQSGENHYYLKNITINQPKYDYTDCITKQVPYCYKVDLFMECDSGPKKGKQLKYQIEVPKMCEHGFLIADPIENRVKFRSPILIGELHQRLVLRGTKKKHDRYIRFGYEIYIYIDPKFNGVPSISIYEKYGDKLPKVNFPLTGYLNHYGIDINNIKGDFNKKLVDITEGEYALIGIPESDIDYYNNKILQLTKVDPKLTKQNPYLDPKIIAKLVETALLTPLIFEPFTPFDITFMDFTKSLFDIDLRRQEFIQSKLARSIEKNGDIGLSITKSIYKSFSMQTESGSVQVATTSNALSFLSQSHKIYFKKYKKGQRGSKIPMTYSSDFYGIICPTKTPESVTLTSIKNEVASDVSFDENHNIMIAVIPKESFLSGEMKAINISYGEYYRARILSLDNIDYRINKVIPINGYVKIFNLGEFKEVKFTGNDCFDYVRQSPEGALSYNAGLIPMANRCDGTRLAMATNMIDQAIPLLGARKSIIKTSVNKLVFDKSNFNIKSPVDGTVVRIVDKYITIDLGNGKYRTFSVPDSINTSMHTSNRFLPYVEVGNKIKKGDILYVSDSFKGGELAITVPLRVAYYSIGIRGMEDSIVISESASKLLGHKLTKYVRIDIPSKASAIFNKAEVEKTLINMNRINSYRDRLALLNDFGLPILGTEYSGLKRHSVLLYLMADAREGSARGQLIMLNKKQKRKVANQLYQLRVELVPREFSEGTIESVRVFHKDTKEVVDEYKDLIEYYDKVEQQRIKDITGGLDTEVPEYKVELNKKGKIDLSIIIGISSIAPATISDKITTRYASKGTISAVMPDNLMPRIGDEDGLPVQIVLPPLSTINRKNIAQIYEMNLCLMCKIAYDKNTEYINNNKFDKAREVLNNLYVTDRFNNYSDNDIKEFHKTFDEYYSIEVNSIDNIYTPNVMSRLNNYFEINEDGYHLYNPGVSERITIKPATVGITEIMRLHFIAGLKSKATADIQDSESLVLYGGDTRSGGQKIGEMERNQVAVHDIEAPVNNLLINSGGLSLHEASNIKLLNQARGLGIEVDLFKDLGKV